MECDIADDILKALVCLLHPQREIELGKLFNEATKSISDSSDENDNDFSETVNGNADDRGELHFALFEMHISLLHIPGKIILSKKRYLLSQLLALLGYFTYIDGLGNIPVE